MNLKLEKSLEIIKQTWRGVVLPCESGKRQIHIKLPQKTLSKCNLKKLNRIQLNMDSNLVRHICQSGWSNKVVCRMLQVLGSSPGRIKFGCIFSIFYIPFIVSLNYQSVPYKILDNGCFSFKTKEREGGQELTYKLHKTSFEIND